MQKYASADTFMEWLEEQCIRLNASQGRERENKAKGIIEEAKQKIQEEFGDPDIGLEKIAAEVGLTQTYFSSLFKKETGMSFVEYLTDTRMKEAMRLLKETSEKIYVVAQIWNPDISAMYLRKNMECPRSSAADRGNRREVVCGGKSDRTFGSFCRNRVCRIFCM